MNKILTIYILCVGLACGNRVNENRPKLVEVSKDVDGLDLLSSENVNKLLWLEKNVTKSRANRNNVLDNDEEMEEILRQYNNDAIDYCTNLVTAQWNVAIDLENTEYATDLAAQVIANADFRKERFNTHFKDVNFEDYEDESNRRQLRYLTKLGINILSEEKLNELSEANAAMEKIYNSAEICPFSNQNCLESDKLSLDPDIEHIMATSKDFEELKYVWEQWHDSTGPGMRSDYAKFMSISNEAAVANSFTDTGHMWRFDYEDDNLKENMLKLWEEVEPLYNLLHTYIRYRLIEEYGLDKMDATDDLIPAHLLGNMWGQSWVNLYERFKPFNAADIDVTNKMVDQNYDAFKMFEIANEFYMNLTLGDATMSFTGDAVIEKIDGKRMVCHASAWDFCDGVDFRIKQCTVVNMVDFVTVFHELGHIQYYIQYAEQPSTFRSGANPGFHEAVGDLMALSASTPKYLSKIGLLEGFEDSYQNDINSLFKMALERVAFLPFGLLIDMYRWDLFEGWPEDEWNKHWEEMREKYQKIRSPVPRTEEHFDAGAKFHVASGYQYINYFFAHILEFQLHEAMCKIAGEYDPDDTENKPLHRCSIDGSAEVGSTLKAGLSLGLSKHWSEALEKMTGQTELLASSVITYFEPLTLFLEEEIKKLERENEMRLTLKTYNNDAKGYCTNLVTAQWNVAIDLENTEYATDLAAQVIANADFRKERFNTHFKDVNYEDYEDESNRRQLRYLTKLGINILSEEKLNELSEANAAMEKIYNSAEICPFSNQNCLESEKLSLDPDIEHIMATSEDFEELKYVWEQWHDSTGPGMRSDYAKFMSISNEAAVANSFADTGEMWRFDYEDDNLKENMLKLWEEVEPLYNLLHTYIRYRLIEEYGLDKMDATDDLIPAHLLGNMWGQSWVNLYERFKPFNAADIDVTNKMVDQNYDAFKMFEIANEFYMNLTLGDATMSFTGNAVIEKIDGKRMVCHASAWDFCDGVDFRIKQCTVVNMVDFVTVFHELGHIQYYIQYAEQPSTFRSGANPGFHEAVGDLMALSASTPKYLSKIGLLEGFEDSRENDINSLFKMALERVAFLPFGLLIDMYRWDLFEGWPEGEWNKHWEEMREKYQKIRSPVPRTEEHFDAGAKFHVASGYQYINYFFAHILEFQLHEAMCKIAGEYDPDDTENKPLHRCSIDGSAAVGSTLKAGLSLGLSKHWSEALEKMTGQTELSASSVITYFAPLTLFLEEEIKKIERENEMRSTLEIYNNDAIEYCTNLVTAQWNVAIDLENTEYATDLAAQVIENADFRKERFNTHFKDVNYEDYEDESNRRQLRYLTKLGINILSEEKLNELFEANAAMEKIYNSAEICPFNNQNCLENEKLSLDPDIEHIMATSEDFEELKYVWEQWHDSTGPGMRSDYAKFMSISNEAAVANSFADTGEMWRFDYEDDNLKENMLKLWEEVEPLYNLLHTYIRYQLIEEYGLDKMDASDDLIPAHLLGNMWGQSWVNLYERFKPFDAADIDVTNKMVEQNYDPLKMFEIANEFYTNLTLGDATMSFTGNAVIEKIDGKRMVCHASAWDFCDGVDFRIKQCTVVNMVDFVTVFHELGHIQYYIQYAEQPTTFRSGANPGFHEAVGDLMALSASTPKYLSKIGLLEGFEDSRENDINSLFKMALERVAFLPFGLLIDMYRWDLFEGWPEAEWNKHWEEMREKYQKIRSPVPRTEEHFDAGAKFHVASGYQYINYFFAHILEFQLHEAMCKIAGEYDPDDTENKPLHRCSIDGSAAVGSALKAGLSLGLSKHWTEALEKMTGQTELSASSVITYFEPLILFLEEEIENWPKTQIQRDIQMRGIIMNYNVEAEEHYQNLVVAEWDLAINLNTQNQNQLAAMSIANARFIKDEYNKHFAHITANNFTDEYNRRQLIYLTNLGTNILSDAKLTDLTSVSSEMEKIYSSAKICPFDNQNCNTTTSRQLSLNPDIEEIMAISTDFDELKYVWEQWHDNTGPGMREFYPKFIELSNEAAVENSFTDTGDMWRHDYEDSELKNNMLNLWEKVEPLYLELHTYVRRKLLEEYGSDKINVDDELIPAHLLGNMWGQSWVNLYERIRPFKNSIDIDVTNKMVEQGYDPHKMFEMANEFYMNLTLDDATMSFTGDAVIEKIDGQEMVCHASAWDFGNGKDFRIKQCTVVNMVDFMTVFHELGHIQYFIQYADQPLIFRNGANPGFHEAIGDLMALSASTPKYLSKIGLLDEYVVSYENDINSLFKMALERVAFLPFGLLIDMYRWDLFEGLPEDEWNKHWEELREKYQKIRSPVPRTEEHFDAGAKFHVASGYQYINYFFAHILEFQLHEAMCKLAGEYDADDTANKPLHRCSIDGSAAVGSRLKAGLSLGLSKHWSETLEILTGETELSESAILEYFSPLYEFLLIENRNAYKNLELPLVPIIVGGILGVGFISAAIGAYIYYLYKRRLLINESFTHP